MPETAGSSSVAAGDEFLQAMPGNTPVRKSVKGYPEQVRESEPGAGEAHADFE